MTSHGQPSPSHTQRSGRFLPHLRTATAFVAMMVAIVGVFQIDKRYLKDFADVVKISQSEFDSATGAVKSPSGETLATTLPLHQLVDIPSSRDRKCNNPNLVYIAHRTERPKSMNRIPNIIHQTSKSQCLHPSFVRIVNRWKSRLMGYSHYLHDDEAVWRLLNKDWSKEFPHLKNALQCVNSMTAISDIWRYLVLWEYGGIYSDLDAGPTSFNAETILPEDDALFVVEHFDAPSQYWMAASPKHPIMYYAVNQALLKVMMLEDIGVNDAAMTTGPFALLDALTWFMYDVGVKNVTKPIVAGLYQGRYNRTVRIIGEGRDKSHKIIRREFLSTDEKIKIYNEEMDMQHFHQAARRWRARNRTCLSVFYDLGVGPPEGFEAPPMGLDKRKGRNDHDRA